MPRVAGGDVGKAELRGKIRLNQTKILLPAPPRNRQWTNAVLCFYSSAVPCNKMRVSTESSSRTYICRKRFACYQRVEGEEILSSSPIRSRMRFIFLFL